MSGNGWNEIARRCEEATGADREIDWAIGLATGWRCDIIDGRDMILDWECNAFPEHPGAIWPSVTESLDVITALIERELPGWYWLASTRATPLGKHTAEGVISNGELFMTGKHRGWDVFAHTPALALCAAFCRAMAAKEPQP